MADDLAGEIVVLLSAADRERTEPEERRRGGRHTGVKPEGAAGPPEPILDL